MGFGFRIHLLAHRNLLWDILRLPSSCRAALGHGLVIETLHTHTPLGNFADHIFLIAWTLLNRNSPVCPQESCALVYDRAKCSVSIHNFVRFQERHVKKCILILLKMCKCIKQSIILQIYLTKWFDMHLKLKMADNFSRQIPKVCEFLIFLSKITSIFSE